MNLIKFIKTPKPYILIALSRIKNKWRIVFYKGDVVLCEICGWKGRQFFDEHCPKCNSLPRTRLIPFALSYFKLTDSQPKIMHIAPNVNEYHYIKKHITNLDNYDRLNIRAVPHINIVQDLRKTNLPDNHYDLVIAWHVLEHIPEDLQAISEVYRFLKTGGHFLVSVPIYPKNNKTTYEDANIAYKDYERIHGHDDHCRSCGFDYYRRFEPVGFKTNTLNVASVSPDLRDYYGLREDHVVWCFTK